MSPHAPSQMTGPAQRRGVRDPRSGSRATIWPDRAREVPTDLAVNAGTARGLTVNVPFGPSLKIACADRETLKIRTGNLLVTNVDFEKRRKARGAADEGLPFHLVFDNLYDGIRGTTHAIDTNEREVVELSVLNRGELAFLLQDTWRLAGADAKRIQDYRAKAQRVADLLAHDRDPLKAAARDQIKRVADPLETMRGLNLGADGMILWSALHRTQDREVEAYLTKPRMDERVAWMHVIRSRVFAIIDELDGLLQSALITLAPGYDGTSDPRSVARRVDVMAERLGRIAVRPFSSRFRKYWIPELKETAEFIRAGNADRALEFIERLTRAILLLRLRNNALEDPRLVLSRIAKDSEAKFLKPERRQLAKVLAVPFDCLARAGFVDRGFTQPVKRKVRGHLAKAIDGLNGSASAEDVLGNVAEACEWL